MEEKKVQALESPTNALESMKRNDIIYAPNHQRISLEGTRGRLKNVSTKLFRFNKINDMYFSITRTR